MTYPKNQEDRMERHMIDIGMTLIEDTGRRKKHQADRIFKHPNGLEFAVDHKSTRNKEGFRIERDMLDKTKDEAKDRIPVITFSFLDSQKMYAVIEIDDLGTILDY